MKKLFFAAALGCAAFMTACGGNSTDTPVTMGDKSQFDSLSYVIGSNIARTFNYQFRDLPLNWDVVEEALVESALAKHDSVNFVKYDDNARRLNMFMWQTRRQRGAAIAKERAEADSIRLASGDSTKIEHPAADPKMFISEGERDSISYAIGNGVGFSLGHDNMPVKMVWVVKAMQDVRNQELMISEDVANAYSQNYFMKVVPEQNMAASVAWLEEMASKSGAQTTESGLVYKIIDEGDMNVKATKLADRVKVRYTGRFRNGKVFDSSIYENLPVEAQVMRRRMMGDDVLKNEPIEFALNQVVKGWGEGMQLVGKGGKIMLWIPSDLAYGPRGRGNIKANEALEFEIELVDVIPAPEMPAEKPSTLPEKPEKQIIKPTGTPAVRK